MKTLMFPVHDTPKSLDLDFTDYGVLTDLSKKLDWEWGADLIYPNSSLVVAVSDTGRIEHQPLNVLASMLCEQDVYGHAVLFLDGFDEKGERDLKPCTPNDLVKTLHEETE